MARSLLASGSSSTIRAVGIRRTSFGRSIGSKGRLGASASAPGGGAGQGIAGGGLAVVARILGGVAREANRHRRPLAERARGGDPAAVQLDELLDDAQAEPEPALFEADVARGVGAGIERGEERR